MSCVPAGTTPFSSVSTVTGAPTGSPAASSIWNVTSVSGGHPSEVITVAAPGATGLVTSSVGANASTVTSPSPVLPFSSVPTTVKVPGSASAGTVIVVPGGTSPFSSVVTMTGSPTGSPFSSSSWNVTSVSGGHPPDVIVVGCPGFTGPESSTVGVQASTVTSPSPVLPSASVPTTVKVPGSASAGTVSVVPAGMLPSASASTVIGSPTGLPSASSSWNVMLANGGHPPEVIVVDWPGFTGPESSTVGVHGSTVTVASAVIPSTPVPTTV